MQIYLYRIYVCIFVEITFFLYINKCVIKLFKKLVGKGRDKKHFYTNSQWDKHDLPFYNMENNMCYNQIEHNFARFFFKRQE